MKVVFAGGGTGGHIYPGITMATTIAERDPGAQILFLGAKRGLESDIVPKEGFQLALIDVAGFRRKLSLETVVTAVRAFRGFMQASAILRKVRPDVVVGTGGYVSGPVVLAARLARIPTLIHEQNALPGYTTRVLSRIVDAVAVTYPEAVPYLSGHARVYVTGNPVRRSILTTTRREGLQALGLDSGRPTLLVFGGSQGARVINEAMVRVLPSIMRRGDVQVIYQTGKRDYDQVLLELKAQNVAGLGSTPRLLVEPYIYDMGKAMACADLVVSRAGAISIAEITACGLPSILIPFSGAAEGHQEKNARALEAAGAAVVVLERELTAKTLLQAVEGLLDDRERLRRMSEKSRGLGRPRAADDLADLIMRLARGS